GLRDGLATGKLAERARKTEPPLVCLEGHAVVRPEPAPDGGRIDPPRSEIAVADTCSGVRSHLIQQRTDGLRRLPARLHRAASQAWTVAVRHRLARGGEELDVVAGGLPGWTRRPAEYSRGTHSR